LETEFFGNAKNLAFGSNQKKKDPDSGPGPLYKRIGQVAVRSDFFKESLAK